MFTQAISVRNARVEHSEGIHQIIRSLYEIPKHEASPAYIMSVSQIARHIQHFARGVFVALHQDKVVGYAITLRTNHSPHETPQPWLQAIGGLGMKNHDPAGEWLYGVDFGVHSDYRRRGIGTMLYKARFQLVYDLNLRGFFAGGMLVGYAKVHSKMSVAEYGRQIINGDVYDATVTMQMNRGFKALRVIENYTHDQKPYNNAMLIAWTNTRYRPRFAPVVAATRATQAATIRQ